MSASSVVSEMVDDAAEFLDGRVDDLRALLEDVRALGNEAAPPPGPDLAVLLAGTPAAVRSRPAGRLGASRPVRVRRRVTGVAAFAVAGLGLTCAAAVANELPAPLQRAVAHLSEDYLPFDFPRPVGDPPVESRPAPPASGARGDAEDPATRDLDVNGPVQAGPPGQAGRSPRCASVPRVRVSDGRAAVGGGVTGHHRPRRPGRPTVGVREGSGSQAAPLPAAPRVDPLSQARRPAKPIKPAKPAKPAKAIDPARAEPTQRRPSPGTPPRGGHTDGPAGPDPASDTGATTGTPTSADGRPGARPGRPPAASPPSGEQPFARCRTRRRGMTQSPGA